MLDPFWIRLQGALILRAMRALILGCGYVGSLLGADLVRQGHEVFGVRRSSDHEHSLKALGIQPLVADVSKIESLSLLPESWDWVVNLVSSGRGGVAEYRQTYLQGTRNLIEWLSAKPPRKYVHVGSTSVYGQIDGSQVKETSSTEPASETSQVLIETEKLLLEAARTKRFPAVLLRSGGIYGPNRCHYLDQYIANETRISGRGERYLNMIHLDDLVGIAAAMLKDGRPGEVYNAVDDEPVMEVHFYRWLSETLGKWMPPFADQTTQGAPPKRGVTNKRVLNRRLKMELGYRLKYPTFRQGYTAEIQRLERAGLLNIAPEPRS